ncbi:hypothetical protein ElyMa_000554400 [Elysia marginata]|uniref:Uncharacterized protein n=1 Tax=Elysia marginata TaxID=1093978 RepID=A0AAV4G0X9_9GAST|nr:hypothetical protein ElyMa_000554400 [Elysia marginata]
MGKHLMTRRVVNLDLLLLAVYGGGMGMMGMGMGMGMPFFFDMESPDSPDPPPEPVAPVAATDAAGAGTATATAAAGVGTATSSPSIISGSGLTANAVVNNTGAVPIGTATAVPLVDHPPQIPTVATAASAAATEVIVASPAGSAVVVAPGVATAAAAAAGSGGGVGAGVSLTGTELDAAVASITEQAMRAMKQAYGIKATSPAGSPVSDVTSALVAKAVAAANQAQAQAEASAAGVSEASPSVDLSPGTKRGHNHLARQVITDTTLRPEALVNFHPPPTEMGDLTNLTAAQHTDHAGVEPHALRQATSVIQGRIIDLPAGRSDKRLTAHSTTAEGTPRLEATPTAAAAPSGREIGAASLAIAATTAQSARATEVAAAATAQSGKATEAASAAETTAPLPLAQPPLAMYPVTINSKIAPFVFFPVHLKVRNCS